MPKVCSGARIGVQAPDGAKMIIGMASRAQCGLLVAAAICGLLNLYPTMVQADEPVPTDTAATQVPVPEKTGKERLSDKASDEQRVDNCKVPPERQGTKARPDDCAQAGRKVPLN
jgi:hypothetical protein